MSNRLFGLMIVLGALSLGACESKNQRPMAPSTRLTNPVMGPMVRPIGLLFAGMDLDFDRVVTSDEAVDGIAAEWSRVDPGDDLRVTAFDIAAWAESSLGSKSALPNHVSFDTDLDGEVTKLEFSDRLRQEFRKLDKNGDNRIVRAELVTDMPLSARRGQRGGRRGGQGGGRRGSNGGEDGHH